MRMPGLSLNPVLARESRVRMRGWKAPALISLYVGLLGLAVAGILLVASFDPGGAFAPELGSIIYAFLVYAQWTLLLFSAPGLTAAAISGERERQTLDLLLLTRMSPMQVVIGKLGAAVSFSILLMFAALPVYSVLFLLGGVSLYNLTLTVLVYIVTVIFLGTIGVYYSALFKRTQAAVVASYGTALGLIVLTMVMSVLHFEIFNRPPDKPAAWGVIWAYLNPLMGITAAAGGPTTDLLTLYRNVLDTPEAREAIWWKYCLTALGLSAGLMWLTARRIRPLKNQ